MSEYRDRRALRAIAKGDVRGLDDLYARHASLLAFRLRRSGASVEEAEDAIQETFLDVWRFAAGHRGDGAVGAWLWGIARRKYAMIVRSEVRSRARERSVAEPHQSSVGADVAATTTADLETALHGLEPDLRDVFELGVIEDKPVRDIARDLGIPEGTVKSRLSRAREAVRKEMQ